MLKSLWFMIQAAAVVAVCVWVADRPGSVRIEWMEYTFTVHFGFFLLISLCVLILAMAANTFVRWVASMPARYRKHEEEQAKKRGYQSLTRGLTAVAAGDVREAVKHAQRTQKLLPDDTGLPVLLAAQAARLDGREDDARKSFAQLITDQDAGFLGVRGLLQSALDYQEHDKALELAYQALKIHPKQKWVLRTVYDLEIKLRLWDAALETLFSAQKAKAFEIEHVIRDRATLLILRAEEELEGGQGKAAIKSLEKAFKLDAGFSPAAVRLAKMYHQGGKRAKALKVIQQAWNVKPHPDLADIWMTLIDKKAAAQNMPSYRWYKKLLKINDTTPEALIGAARLAMSEDMWGQASAYLKKAEEIAPSKNLYALLAELEERSGGGEKAAQHWQEKAQDAPDDKGWVCYETGRGYPNWQPIAQPHGSFNTIIWGVVPLSQELRNSKLSIKNVLIDFSMK